MTAGHSNTANIGTIATCYSRDCIHQSDEVKQSKVSDKGEGDTIDMHHVKQGSNDTHVLHTKYDPRAKK